MGPKDDAKLTSNARRANPIIYREDLFSFPFFPREPKGRAEIRSAQLWARLPTTAYH